LDLNWYAGQDGPPSAQALARPGKTALLPGRFDIKAMDGFDIKLVS
jgi:hypothetical protein